MKKLLKLGFSAIVLALLAAIAGVVALFIIMPTRTVPYPYVFDKKEWDGLDEANRAQVLLIGDRMGHQLAPYLKAINDAIDPMLREPLRVYSWARQGEGLHRSLERLKQLERWPRILILHGLSQELDEQRFYMSGQLSIAKNFVRYDNETISSLIMGYPPLSRILFHPHRLVRLGEVTPYLQTLEAHQQQQRFAMTYLLLSNELRELITLARRNETSLIFITTPLNLEERPRQVCENAQTPTMLREQRDIESLIEAEKFKEAYARAEQLATQTPGNALNYYLKGISAMNIGQLSEAQGSLQLATAYDCRPWRANVVTNQLLLTMADSYKFTVLDFDFMVNQNLGRDVLFLNELYPQDIYYQRLAQRLVDEVKLIYRL